MPDNVTLDDAVTAAVTKEVGAAETVSTSTEQKVEESAAPEESKVETPAAALPSHEETEKTRHALALYDALVDPSTRENTIKYLMREAGLDPTSKQEVKEAKKDTVAYLKSALGDTYSDFAEVLGPAFDKLLSDKLEEHTKPLREQVMSQQQALAERQADAAMESFHARHKTVKAEREALEKSMEAKIRQMPAAGDQSIDEYLDDIYYLVSRQKSETKAVKETVDKINRNAKDGSRLSGVETERVNRGSHLPTLDEAVRAAYRGEKIDQ